MAIKIFVGLILCNLIWSFHPIFGKWLLDEVPPMQAAWLRYASALIAYGAAALVYQFKNAKPQAIGFKTDFFIIPSSLWDRCLFVILGFMAFCFSPLSQMTGLSNSLAIENAVIIAMEPLMTAFLAWVLLRETMSLLSLIGFILALMGFVLLAGVSIHPFHLGIGVGTEPGKNTHFIGNFLILFSLLGEASFSVLGRKLTRTYSPLGIFGTCLAVGVALLTLVVGWETQGRFLSQLPFLSWKCLFALFCIGPIGTAACYLYYMFALKEVSVMSTVVFLFLQPLAGSFFGYWFLGEHLLPSQAMGSILILLGVIMPSQVYLKKRSTH